jgi:predicted XRE-type DNA-binding protein
MDKLSCKKIAEHIGVTQMTISKILRKLGIEPRKSPEKYIPRTVEMCDKIKKWYCEDCLTQRDIAEVLGVGEISVHSFMRDIGIKTRGLSERLKVRRKIDVALLITQNNESKKWRHNRKGAYNRVTCHQCGVSYTRPLSALNEKFHFCGNACHRAYSLEHGIIPGRRPNLSEEKLLSLLHEISDDWRYIGDGSKIIYGRNPDFWDGKTNLIEFFGEPWHPRSDEEERITHYRKHGYNCMVVWWEELIENKKTHALENRIMEWYATASS